MRFAPFLFLASLTLSKMLKQRQRLRTLKHASDGMNLILNDSCFLTFWPFLCL